MSEKYGGWQTVATALCEAGFENTSRQMVYGWWQRRDKIGFPEGRVIESAPRGGGFARQRVLLPVDKVIEWRKTYVPDPGGRPRKDRS